MHRGSSAMFKRGYKKRERKKKKNQPYIYLGILTNASLSPLEWRAIESKHFQQEFARRRGSNEITTCYTRDNDAFATRVL